MKRHPNIDYIRRRQMTLLTKNDMARAVVTALYNCQKLVKPNDVRVVWMVNKHTKAWLQARYPLAMKILNDREKEKVEC